MSLVVGMSMVVLTQGDTSVWRQGKMATWVWSLFQRVSAGQNTALRMYMMSAAFGR